MSDWPCRNFRPHPINAGLCTRCNYYKIDHVDHDADISEAAPARVASKGCICPPGSERTCKSPTCPRHDHRSMGEKLRDANKRQKLPPKPRGPSC